MTPTPIADFIEEYIKSSPARFHMPGHKGEEPRDITEIDGAGDLFSKDGIVAESERAASEVFGFRTYYSAEGSSLAIRTMVALASRGKKSKKALAGRNAHRTFISALALLDIDPVWMYPKRGESYLSCSITPRDVASALDAMDEAPCFVYITSPDYLGNVADVAGIAKVCHERGVKLLVDSAHGAYLKFLEPSRHPIDLGADMCAASAHKTLPVLTGGAYLHLSDSAASEYENTVKETMSFFASSSPSYLIMRSLDLANRYLETYPEVLSAFVEKVDKIKKSLKGARFSLVGDEPLKITVASKKCGYTGDALASELLKRKVIPEFHNAEFVSFMLTPSNSDEDLERLENSLLSIEFKAPIEDSAPEFDAPKVVMTVREAFFVERETVPVSESAGRVFASFDVSCPPAVPVLLPGEEIGERGVYLLKKFGKEYVTVVKQ